jgi:tetratricopeptide (TPR) repeat protein
MNGNMIDCIEKANSLIERRKYKEARDELARFRMDTEGREDIAPIYLAEANSYLAEGRMDDAERVVQKLLQVYEGSLVRLYGMSYLAQIAHTREEYALALTTIEKAQQLISNEGCPEDGADICCKIVAQHGYVLNALCRWQESLDILSRAKSLCGEDNDEWHNIRLHLAYCLQALHRNDEAIRELDDIENSKENMSTAFMSEVDFRRGAILLEMKNHVEAYHSFLRAEASCQDEKLSGAIRAGKERAAQMMPIQ